MATTDPALEPQQTRRSRHAQPGSTAAPHDQALPALEPRPVAVAGSVLAGSALALAGATSSPEAVVGVVTAAGLVLALGLPRLAGLRAAVAGAVVIALTSVGLAVARLAKDTHPLLEATPVAAGLGVVLMCLSPLASSRVRAGLTGWLAGTSMGICLLVCGIVLTAVEGTTALVVAGAAVAVSSLVDLLLERDRLRAWMLPAAVAVGALVGLAAPLALGDPLAPWTVLLGTLCAAVALAVRRVAAPLPGIVEPRAALAAGAAGVLAVGPVVLTVARLLGG